MANDTKERILEAALEMFSQNGYATNKTNNMADKAYDPVV